MIQMAIVNLTPDSFYEPSRVWVDGAGRADGTGEADGADGAGGADGASGADALATAALRRIQELLNDGADIIDLGAVSTRPGAAEVTVDAEWSRLHPVLAAIAAAQREGGSPSGVTRPQPADVCHDGGNSEDGCSRRDLPPKRDAAVVHPSSAAEVSPEVQLNGPPAAKSAQNDAGGTAVCTSGNTTTVPDYSINRTIPHISVDTTVPHIPDETALLPLISIDTTSAEIVRRAYDTIGRFIVNDISAGEDDPKMLPTVAELGLPYIAMHKRGNPRTMDSLCDYPDGIMAELKRYFSAFSAKAEALGIREWILDPGLGFAKTDAQNWEILERLEELKAFGRPILIGAADKRFTRNIPGGNSGSKNGNEHLSGNVSSNSAISNGTAAAHALAIAHGADILRIHSIITP